jgi:predicted DNA-binding transcriptional regulator YafY
LPIESPQWAAAQLIRHGVHVEVLAPGAVREALAELAASVAAMYETG